ncbi:MAG: hypothetical protein ACOX9R_01965 [Armatimonadota bacterium]|jgi:hypothetical protein
MKRTLVVVVASLLIAGAAFAQCPMMGAIADVESAEAMTCPHGMQMGMQMQQGPMASMMGAMDTAVHGDFVYVLQGNMLEKRDMDGNVVRSVQLEGMEQMMEQMEADGVCPMCGMPMDMEAREGCPGAMMGGMHGQQSEGMQGGMGQMHGRMHGGGMMGEGATEEGMRGMQRGRMHSKVKLEADADGVYLLRGGKFTKFDHDLNKVKSWDAVSEACLAKDDSVQCAMRQMQRAQCPTCRMMTGRLVDERAIEAGSVAMWHRPAVLTAGTARFQVQVRDAARQGDARATVSGYLYPQGNVNAGTGVDLQSVGGGQFFGFAEIPEAGHWLLALRVKRPGMEDVRVYYDLPVE